MEIEVGEYIRTDNGIIIKYQFLEESENFEVFFGQKGKGFTFEDMEEFEDFINQRVVKHSKNIIDLIEEGDYVNGKRVVYINTIEDGDGNKRLCVFVEETQDCIEQNEIKSIVTKEQFSQMKYNFEE
jgi:hypothetical protein